MSPPDDNPRKKMITIVGKKQAREGYVFVFHGPLSECKACKVKNICFSLAPGQTYIVTSVRDITHSCEVFADGAQVVEVLAHPRTMAVDGKKAMEGSVVTLKEAKCKNVACPLYHACMKHGLRPGDKLKIVSVVDKLVCPEGRVAVEVIPAD